MKITCLFAAVLFLAVGVRGASAQAVPTVAVQVGYDVGYNVGASDVGNAFDMSLNLGLTDSLQVGVTFLSGDGAQFQSYRLLELSYAVMPKLGALVSIGSQTTGAGSPLPVAGLGLYSNLLGKDVQGSLQTGLKLLVEYLAPIGTSFDSGTLRLGIVAWVGL